MKEKEYRHYNLICVASFVLYIMELDYEYISKKTRKREYSSKRAVFSCVMNVMFGYSYREIATYLDFDRATVFYYLRSSSEMKDIKEEIDKLILNIKENGR